MSQTHNLPRLYGYSVSEEDTGYDDSENGEGYGENGDDQSQDEEVTWYHGSAGELIDCLYSFAVVNQAR
jgi:hypothetical protein